MSKRLIITIVIIIVVGILFFSFFKLFYRKNKNNTIKSIKSLEYTSSDGRSSYINYKIVCNDECFLEGKPYGLYNDDVFKFKIDDKDISLILDVLNKYHVEKWDGFDKADKHVLDGTSFSFYLTTKEGVKISAHGYMKYPNNYSEVMGELKSIFERVKKDNYRSLYELDYFSDFKKEDIVKVVKETITESGISSEEYTTSEGIMKILSEVDNILIFTECSMRCEDNTLSYTFVMNNSKKYRIDKECNWLVIDGMSYYYEEK